MASPSRGLAPTIVVARAAGDKEGPARSRAKPVPGVGTCGGGRRLRLCGTRRVRSGTAGVRLSPGPGHFDCIARTHTAATVGATFGLVQSGSSGERGAGLISLRAPPPTPRTTRPAPGATRLAAAPNPLPRTTLLVAPAPERGRNEPVRAGATRWPLPAGPQARFETGSPLHASQGYSGRPGLGRGRRRWQRRSALRNGLFSGLFASARERLCQGVWGTPGARRDTCRVTWRPCVK
jgi:hypothetical protein